MFELNNQTAQYAKDADALGGFINEAGKYIGHFESVIWHVKDGVNGKSEGLFFNFISDSKQKARFYINTSYRNGEKNQSGLSLVYAILACLREKSAGEPVNCTVKQYDKKTGQVVDVVKPCFTVLQNKPIGLVIQMVQEDGDNNPKPMILAPFEAETEFTASEILNRSTEKVMLAKMVAHIASKPLYDKRTFKPNSPVSTPAPPQRQRPQLTPAPDDIEDDIPF
ncbi:hypothetical protein [Snodgrassella alvi]|uniref:hypothetical protein n=1 Tax=Snodgrassella alvi TaxID=1196083 RepID=UPI000C1F6339|nr:hypothetical protein [Snodgrassella alvi]PIT21467.1 hypothetical protein BGI34_01285 [Snodgrassella alvi]